MSLSKPADQMKFVTVSTVFALTRHLSSSSLASLDLRDHSYSVRNDQTKCYAGDPGQIHTPAEELQESDVLEHFVDAPHSDIFRH